MDVREKIFKSRLKKVRKQGVRDTGYSLNYFDEQLIPDSMIDTLAEYFNEVSKLKGDDLKKEFQRYYV